MLRINLRLSAALGVALLLAALAVSTLILQQELRNGRRLIIEQSSHFTSVIAAQVLDELSSTFTPERQATTPETVLAVTALIPGVRTVMLTDAAGRILVANRSEWTGEPAADHAHYDPATAAQMLRALDHRVEPVAGAEGLLHAYFPLVLDREMGVVRPFALLYMEVDMAGELAAARHRAIQNATLYAMLTMLSALFVGVALHHYVTRRVQSIGAAAVRLGAGDLAVRTKLKGSDELAVLGRAFDDMARSLESLSQQRSAAEEEIRRLALFDGLTGLPNRYSLRMHVATLLGAGVQSDQYAALIMLDLDHFKRLNDSRGHAAGDELLVEVARRLSTSVPGNGRVFRLGGDEFVVVCSALGEDLREAEQQAERAARQLHAVLSYPYQVDGIEYHSTPSMGLTTFRGPDANLQVLLKQADMAMYQAKDAGRNALRLFSASAQEALEKRMVLEGELHGAVARGEFRLYYQPQVDETGSVIGAEALIRWFPPDKPMVPPGHFIPVAEESGIIAEIGHWVLGEACAQLKAWAADKATRDLEISINISPRQFFQPNLVQEVRAVLEASGANPRRLKLELTEGVVLGDVDFVAARMAELRALGLSFSLDDFGTGYSSLSYLKRLPFAQVKIDRAFVQEINTNARDAAIVRAIVELCGSLDMDVIAEGVETAEQCERLLRSGCRRFQGFHFGRPVPIELWPVPATAGIHA